MKFSLIIHLGFALTLSGYIPAFSQNTTPVLLRNLIIIDGTGKSPQPGMDILIKGKNISSIGRGLKQADALVIDMTGKTLMPSIISTHNHLGILKGTTVNAANFTRENILNQIKKFQDYGVSTIVSMGTDRDLLFHGLKDSILSGLLPGAGVYSAGYGFGVPNGGPPLDLDQIQRPLNAEEAKNDIEKLVPVKPDLIKIWLDDFGGRFPKMEPSVSAAIIEAAHAHGWRVAAHVYYLQDARRLVAQGVDILAHSIRDSLIDDGLIAEMKKKNVAYIPTLSLDDYAYIYAGRPPWMDDDFFKASLEPGVYEIISATSYQDGIKNSPAYLKNKAAFEMALKNLKKMYDAGILVALGTDSGAMIVRTQGFSEHLELQLLVEAGLNPMQAIAIGTMNGAKLLRIDKDQGTIAVGKSADFIILNADPSLNIQNTHRIMAVWKNGKQVSKGPGK